MGKFLNILINDEYYNDSVKNYLEEFYGLQDVIFHDSKNFTVDENEKYYFFKFQEGNYIVNYLINDKKLPISENIENLLKNHKNVFYVFLNDNESETFDVTTNLNFVLENLNYRPEQFYLINANENLGELIENCNCKIKYLNYNLCAFRAVRQMVMTGAYDFDEKEKKHQFCCYNRQVKPHRVGILSLLDKNGLLETIDWTFLRGNEFNQVYFQNFNKEDFEIAMQGFFRLLFDKNMIEGLSQNILKISNIGSKKSLYEIEDRIDFPPHHLDWGLSYNKKSFTNSYINIVTESVYEFAGVVHITEKSIVPFYYMQLPIIAASPNHVKTLKRKYDLDFFEDFINHDYDNEIDNAKRLIMVVNEIVRISKNLDALKEFYFSAKDRLIENQNKIKKIMDTSFVKNELSKLV